MFCIIDNNNARNTEQVTDHELSAADILPRTGQLMDESRAFMFGRYFCFTSV